MNELEEKSLDIVIGLISSGYLDDDDAKILIKMITQKSSPTFFSGVTPCTGIKIKEHGCELVSELKAK